MSLKNMETGQTATPLTMLQEMNEQDRQHKSIPPDISFEFAADSPQTKQTSPNIMQKAANANIAFIMQHFLFIFLSLKFVNVIIS